MTSPAHSRTSSLSPLPTPLPAKRAEDTATEDIAAANATRIFQTSLPTSPLTPPIRPPATDTAERRTPPTPIPSPRTDVHRATSLKADIRWLQVTTATAAITSLACAALAFKQESSLNKTGYAAVGCAASLYAKVADSELSKAEERFDLQADLSSEPSHSKRILKSMLKFAPHFLQQASTTITLGGTMTALGSMYQNNLAAQLSRTGNELSDEQLMALYLTQQQQLSQKPSSNYL